MHRYGGEYGRNKGGTNGSFYSFHLLPGEEQLRAQVSMGNTPIVQGTYPKLDEFRP